MVDASLAGFGITEGIFHASELEEAGSLDERWRFKMEYQQAERPRATALREMDPLRDLDTVKPVRSPARWVWGFRQTSPTWAGPCLSVTAGTRS